MGYGGYSHDAHVAMTSGRSAVPVEAVFKQRACHPQMDPRGVGQRECRDSPDHPQSVPIVFALDVSGSMGEIPATLATSTLPGFMKALADVGVADPQVLFMAVGNAISDQAPLQVGQFESTADLMDKWLTSMFLEGGGAGGDESYELAMYFAARHTALDSVEKRGKKGFLFITGDENPNPAVAHAQVRKVIGDVLPADLPMADMIAEVSEKYEPFYLIPEPGRAGAIEAAWRGLLRDRVIVMSSPHDTSHVAAALVALVHGLAIDEVIRRFRGVLPAGRASEIGKAVRPFAASLG